MVKYDYYGKLCFVNEPKCGRFSLAIDISDGKVVISNGKEDKKGLITTLKEDYISLRTGDRLIMTEYDEFGDEVEVMNELLVRNRRASGDLLDKFTFVPFCDHLILEKIILLAERHTSIRVTRVYI